MNTSVVTLQNIRSDFPDASDAIARLEELLSEDSDAKPEYTLEHIYEVVHPSSLGTLAQILSWLMEHQYLERVIRVVSPESRAGLKDFLSLGDLPEYVFDDVDTGGQIPVTDKSIEVLYRLK